VQLFERTLSFNLVAAALYIGKLTKQKGFVVYLSQYTVSIVTPPHLFGSSSLQRGGDAPPRH
jgi:hypothetical protein